MNHPYLYPDEAPWTDDYQELLAARRANHGSPARGRAPEERADGQRCVGHGPGADD